jgi:hypothetical protein
VPGGAAGQTSSISDHKVNIHWFLSDPKVSAAAEFEHVGGGCSRPVRMRILPRTGTPQVHQDKGLAECKANLLKPSPTKRR